MREESIAHYIWFGTVLRFLQDADEGQRIQGKDRIARNLRGFLRALEDLGLTVTLNAAHHARLHEKLEEFESVSAEAVLTKKEAADLRLAVDNVRLTLDAESLEKKAFVTAPKRWDVDRLLTDPGAIFAKDVFRELDPLASYDFSEACKCIAFERSTAGAFHMLRGTESVLRSFYCHNVRRKRLVEKQRTWGAMLEQLRKKSAPPPKALLDNLDAIRHNFRNPTQHPDEIYSVDQAQDLLGLVVPAVNTMTTSMAG
jgi:hypothetical protein